MPTVANAKPARTASGLRLLITAGLLTIPGYIALFLLLQSHTIWESPTYINYLWPGFYIPLMRTSVQFLEGISGNDRATLGILHSGAYLAIMAWLFGVYFFTIFRLFRLQSISQKARRWAFGIIFGVAALSMTILFLVPGMFSTDLFSYVFYGRIFAIEGGNPYLQVPADYAASDPDKWLRFVFWRNVPSIYGPVWMMFAGGIALIARALGDSIVYHLLGHKLLAIVAHLVNIALIWQVARIVIARYWPKRVLSAEYRVLSGKHMPSALSTQHSALTKALGTRHSALGGWRAAAQVAVTLTYAWNPLMMVEFGVSGHNDILIVTGLLVGLWLHLSGHWRLAVVAIAVATQIKLTASLVFLIPYLAFLFWQGYSSVLSTEYRVPSGTATRLHRLQSVIHSVLGTRYSVLKLGQGVGIAALVWVITWLPFWTGPEILAAYFNSPPNLLYVHSLGSFIRGTLPGEVRQLGIDQHWTVFAAWDPGAIGDALDKPVRLIFLAFTGLVAAFFMWRGRTFRAMLFAMGWIGFIYLVFGSVWFWPWYVAMLVVPVALVGPGRLFNAGLILCASSMAIYSLNPVISQAYARWWGWTGLVIAVPPLSYLLGSLTIEWVRRHKVPSEKLEIRNEKLEIRNERRVI